LAATKRGYLDEGVEPVEKQVDPARFVAPQFEERDQKLAVENEEGQGVR
jgi:hypothetical protein